MKPTIYQALKEKLGREPSHVELKDEVKRIIHEARIEKRSIGAKPKRHVYDARASVNGESFCATADSAKEAKAALLADLDYIASAGCVASEGFKLFPQGDRAWVFQFPHGGSYCFRHDSIHGAFRHIDESYHDHAEVQAFVSAVRAELEARI